MRYFLSDPHMGHVALIGYQNEPFENMDQKEKLITNSIKKTVKKTDELWFLGDMFFHGWNKERATIWVNSLPGRKILIIGNHDRGRSVKWYQDVGFDEVYKYPVIIEEKFIVSHEPIDVSILGRFYNLHGHTHNKAVGSYGYFNMCVEVVNYTPVSFDEILKKVN